MQQTIARLIGTILLTKLMSEHLLPSVFTLTPTETEYFGDGVVLVIVTLWSYLEKIAKGHITLTGRTITFFPANTDDLPDLRNLPPVNSLPQPTAPKPLIDKIDS